MSEAFLFEAVRTPIGKRKGGLSGLRADDLAALPLAEVVRRAEVPMEAVEDVIMGCVTQMGEQGFNVARIAALIAGFPETTCGTSVNRQCGSSLQAFNFAAASVMSGQNDLVIAAGVESMTRVPMGSDGAPPSPKLTERFDIIHQGLSAEMIAAKWELTREELDEYSIESHERALRAAADGVFDREIMKVEVDTPEGPRTLSVDEGPRRGSTIEKLATLPTVFKEDGVVTPASSSQISDGACAVLVGSQEAGRRYGLQPRARVVATAIAGVDPTIMLTGPIPATRKVLQKAGLSIDDIEVFEVNEAFAPVVLAWLRETGAEYDRTNVNGGAIALGHPLGCSGVRLLTTLLHELERREGRYGLATLCIGYGQAVATIIERL
ncbi:MAG: thiolase family protein [Deltaproteobacteria bacterium]|nr:MAG: thiolase family protein [Deltaproteobacteria bacterium]